MLVWSEKKPTEPGWYLWFREEYDTFRRKFIVVYRDGEYLKGYPGNKSIEYIVGGLWYGPIPLPPLAISAQQEAISGSLEGS